MDSRMNLLKAQDQISTRRSDAVAAQRLAAARDERPRPRVIALRVATNDETADLERLAQLDCAPPLSGESLVALVDGDLVAAVSLEDGREIADPFAPTAEVRALLRTRAGQLVHRPRRPRRRLRPRFA